MSKSCLEVAAEAAERVNAMLVAKGKLKINGISGRNSGDLFTTEVEINDAPLAARNVLTKGLFQEEICRTTRAVLSTRGRYMNNVEKMNASSAERPLYIHIQAPHIDAIERAMCRINSIIAEHSKDGAEQQADEFTGTTYTDPCLTANTLLTTGHHHYVQDKIYVGLEQAPAAYPIQEKIMGPNGSYLDHINVTTGATATLRGKGSGFIEPTSGREAFEPLHIHITHPNMDGLQAAKTLAISLIQTTHQDLAEWQQQQLASVALQSAVSIQAPRVASTANVLGLGQAVFQPMVSGTEMRAQGILVGAVGNTSASIMVPVSLTSSLPSNVSYVTALPQTQAVVYPTSQVLAHAVIPPQSVAAPTMVPPPVVVAQAATPTMVPPPSIAVPQTLTGLVQTSVVQPTYVSTSVAPPTLVSTSLAGPTYGAASVAPPTMVSMSMPPPSLASVAPPLMVPPPAVPPPTLQQAQQHVAMVPPPAYIAPTVYPHLRQQYAQYAAAKQSYDTPPPSTTAQQQQAPPQQLQQSTPQQLQQPAPQQLQQPQQAQQQVQEAALPLPLQHLHSPPPQLLSPSQPVQSTAAATSSITTVITTCTTALSSQPAYQSSNYSASVTDDWRFRVPPPPLPISTSKTSPSLPPSTQAGPPVSTTTPSSSTTTTTSASTVGDSHMNGMLYYRSTLPRSKSSFLSSYRPPPVTSSPTTSSPSRTTASLSTAVLFRVPPPPLRSRPATGKADWDLMPPPRAPLSSAGQQPSGGVTSTAAYSAMKRPSDSTTEYDWKRIRGAL
uniref:KH homology domain-containing protein 4 n=1 Tax=Ornithodoros turicata TaxID=34597 RepID=A0A2R5L4B9_9ACAR